MAKRRRNLSNTTNVQTHSFVKGLNKDSDFTYVQNGMWTHARNATNNTIEGNQGTISNASSNTLCPVVTSEGLITIERPLNTAIKLLKQNKPIKKRPAAGICIELAGWCWARDGPEVSI